MPNRKKTVNPIVTQRLNECIASCGKSGRWICRNVLKENNIEYSSSNFSKFTTGKTQPPEWIMRKLAEFFDVRFDWLSGIDDLKTEQDHIRDIVKQSVDLLECFQPAAQYHFEQLLEMYDYKVFISVDNGTPCHCISKNGQLVCTLIGEQFAIIANAVDTLVQHSLANHLDFSKKTMELLLEYTEKIKERKEEK